MAKKTNKAAEAEFEQYRKDNQRYVEHLPRHTQRQVLERMKQAEDRDIRDKAVEVACWCNGYERGADSWNRTFTEGKLVIKDKREPDRDESPGGHHTEIWLGSKQVFQAGIWGTPELYIPGEWEEQLDRLYAKAQRLESKAERARQGRDRKQTHEQVAKEKAKWGL
jgi:hypothetical protein